jgi:hypothetical protein
VPRKAMATGFGLREAAGTRLEPQAYSSRSPEPEV